MQNAAHMGRGRLDCTAAAHRATVSPRCRAYLPFPLRTTRQRSQNARTEHSPSLLLRCCASGGFERMVAAAGHEHRVHFCYHLSLRGGAGFATAPRSATPLQRPCLLFPARGHVCDMGSVCAGRPFSLPPLPSSAFSTAAGTSSVGGAKRLTGARGRCQAWWDGPV